MRWPWSPRPGMRRVNHRELIRLQRNALRAVELEQETTALRRERQLLAADMRASQLLVERRTSIGPVEEPVRAEVMSSLPLTADGVLHETAFLALVDTRAWAFRDRALAELASASE